MTIIARWTPLVNRAGVKNGESERFRLRKPQAARRVRRHTPVASAADSVTEPTFGPSGRQERLNCCWKNRRQNVFSQCRITSSGYLPPIRVFRHPEQLARPVSPKRSRWYRKKSCSSYGPTRSSVFCAISSVLVRGQQLRAKRAYRVCPAAHRAAPARAASRPHTARCSRTSVLGTERVRRRTWTYGRRYTSPSRAQAQKDRPCR